MIMEKRPLLAREEDKNRSTPMHLSVFWDQIDMLKILLERDPSLGYVGSSNSAPLLASAAFGGHVDVARELLRHCPDAPYCNKASGWTCLHEAATKGQDDFLEFILESQQHQLRKVINMRTPGGKTALHHAVEKCNHRMVRALLRHKDIDVTVLNNGGNHPIWALTNNEASATAKTFNWVSMFAPCAGQLKCSRTSIWFLYPPSIMHLD
jgi:ankyrin repeat protein